MIFEYQSLKIHSRANNSERAGIGINPQENGLFQGRKIINQQIFNPKILKSKKIKVQMPINQENYVEISINKQPNHKLKQTIFKKDIIDKHGENNHKDFRNQRHEKQCKIDKQKFFSIKANEKQEKRYGALSKEQKQDNINIKSYSISKSKSKSKGIVKSKSQKQLMKKTKSMVRLDHKGQHHKDSHNKDSQYQQHAKKIQRKSHSPNRQNKSTISYIESKNIKNIANYATELKPKSHRDIPSQQTTYRQKGKNTQKTKLSKKIKRPQEIITNEQSKKKSFSKVKCRTQRQRKNHQLQKQDPKCIEVKLKPRTKPKTKKVIMSQQHKTKRVQQEMINYDDDFLTSKNDKFMKKSKRNKESNIVDTKRNERLSLNSLSKRYNINKNNKTQAQVSRDLSRQLPIEIQAAIKIQKVFRGYLTRKYIRQCFEYNAAINIQRMWRGYYIRKYLKQIRQKILKNTQKQQLKISRNQQKKKQSILQSKKQEIKHKIVEQEQYLFPLQQEQEKFEINDEQKTQTFDWTHVLEEILQEQTINQHIKRKIEKLLLSKKASINQAQYISNKSQKSNTSSFSNQVVYNEINSERLYFEQQKLKKIKPNIYPYISPTNYKSPNQFKYSSPQNIGSKSPVNFIQNRLDQFTSSQLLISNLKNIQKFHRQRLQNKANNQKEELNKMLIKNKLSPRTHEKKFKLVDLNYESQLSKFNESINEIVKNCILYKQESPQGYDNKFKASDRIFVSDCQQFSNDKFSITPKKQLVLLHHPEQLVEQSELSQKRIEKEDLGFDSPRKVYQKSQQFGEYYQSHHEQLPKQQYEEQQFDSSYSFIQQYLINLIDFVRQFNNGQFIQQILQILKKPRNHSPEIIFKNLKPVTEMSQDQNLDNSFKLPMYKYIDQDQQIISQQIIEEFNLLFMKSQANQLVLSQLGCKNSLQECFVKMVVDSMNQALNSLRPTSYIFTSTHLTTLNLYRNMEKIPILQAEINGSEMQYQFMCAQALNKIFYWNKLQWGKIVNMKLQVQVERLQQMKVLLMKQQQTSLINILAKQNWQFLEQTIELIGVLSQDMLQLVIYEEIAMIWQTFISWNQKLEQVSISSQNFGGKKFFLN